MDYLAKQINDLKKKIEETKKLELDPQLAKLAKEELLSLQQQLQTLESPALRPENTTTKAAIIEIRAAAGGNEAGLFAADLYRMYARYSQNMGWRVEQLSLNEGGIGNIKEIIFLIEGEGAYKKLQYESGVHRVQRVPATESSGRIHTSTATVAILPEITESQLHIDPKELRVETFRASGHGGQNVQKVETAVRIVHLPTNLVVTCQSERSQFQNKERAFSVLRSRLYEAKIEAEKMGIDITRKTQVGTGERSEKIRTYNFPQDRITDHRIGKSFHNIEDILNGNLTLLISSLEKHYKNK